MSKKSKIYTPRCSYTSRHDKEECAICVAEMYLSFVQSGCTDISEFIEKSQAEKKIVKDTVKILGEPFFYWEYVGKNLDWLARS